MLEKDDIFFELVDVFSRFSKCLSAQRGALLIKDDRIISIGYNGPPSKIEHCKRCRREWLTSGERLDLCPAVHAEENAILSAGRVGISTLGATMYTRSFPCSFCIKAIIQAGIKKVYYKEDYEDPLNRWLAKQSDVRFIKV